MANKNYEILRRLGQVGHDKKVYQLLEVLCDTNKVLF